MDTPIGQFLLIGNFRRRLARELLVYMYSYIYVCIRRSNAFLNTTFLAKASSKDVKKTHSPHAPRASQSELATVVSASRFSIVGFGLGLAWLCSLYLSCCENPQNTSHRRPLQFAEYNTLNPLQVLTPRTQEGGPCRSGIFSFGHIGQIKIESSCPYLQVCSSLH